jgi:hypothetical protein
MKQRIDIAFSLGKGLHLCFLTGIISTIRKWVIAWLYNVQILLPTSKNVRIYRWRVGEGGFIFLVIPFIRDREMGGQVGSAPACYDSSQESNPDISQKQMGDISKGVANTLYPAKKNLSEIVITVMRMHALHC